MIEKGLGQRLLRIRRERGLSQVDFASRLNVSVGAYQGYERGEREAPSSLLSSMYKEFATDPLWLLGETQEPKGTAAVALGGRALVAPQQLKTAAGRFRIALDWINETHLHSPVTPSQVAERIGEPSASSVEAIFTGDTDPTFAILDRIASDLGLESLWLKHGQARPFNVKRQKAFTAADAAELIAEQPRRVIVVRDLSSGNICIVSDFDGLRYRVVSTDLMLAKGAGRGGLADLAAFSNACIKLFHDRKVSASGAQLPASIFQDLSIGTTYPGSYFGSIVSNAFASRWFDDWWDPQMFDRRNDPYWPDFSETCADVYEVVEESKSLKKERDLILSQVV